MALDPASLHAPARPYRSPSRPASPAVSTTVPDDRGAVATATGRMIGAGTALLAVGVVMLAVGLWLGSDPLTAQPRRLLVGGAFLASGLSLLVTSFRWMRPGPASHLTARRTSDGSLDA